MFVAGKAKKGDILLYKPTGGIIGKLIAFLSYGGKYAHAALYLGNNKIIESHIDTGVVQKALNPKWHKYIDVYRVNLGHTSTQTNKFVKKALDKVGAGYDLGAFPSTFCKSVLARIFGFKNFAKAKPILNDEKTFYCSELISVALYEATMISIVPYVNPSSTTPSDLAFTQLTSLVC